MKLQRRRRFENSPSLQYFRGFLARTGFPWYSGCKLNLNETCDQYAADVDKSSYSAFEEVNSLANSQSFAVSGSDPFSSSPECTHRALPRIPKNTLIYWIRSLEPYARSTKSFCTKLENEWKSERSDTYLNQRKFPSRYNSRWSRHLHRKSIYERYLQLNVAQGALIKGNPKKPRINTMTRTNFLNADSSDSIDAGLESPRDVESTYGAYGTSMNLVYSEQKIALQGTDPKNMHRYLQGNEKYLSDDWLPCPEDSERQFCACFSGVRYYGCPVSHYQFLCPSPCAYHRMDEHFDDSQCATHNLFRCSTDCYQVKEESKAIIKERNQYLYDGSRIIGFRKILSECELQPTKLIQSHSQHLLGTRMSYNSYSPKETVSSQPKPPREKKGKKTSDSNIISSNKDRDGMAPSSGTNLISKASTERIIFENSSTVSPSVQEVRIPSSSRNDPKPSIDVNEESKTNCEGVSKKSCINSKYTYHRNANLFLQRVWARQFFLLLSRLFLSKRNGLSEVPTPYLIHEFVSLLSPLLCVKPCPSREVLSTVLQKLRLDELSSNVSSELVLFFLSELIELYHTFFSVCGNIWGEKTPSLSGGCVPDTDFHSVHVAFTMLFCIPLSGWAELDLIALFLLTMRELHSSATRNIEQPLDSHTDRTGITQEENQSEDSEEDVDVHWDYIFCDSGRKDKATFIPCTRYDEPTKKFLYLRARLFRFLRSHEIMRSSYCIDERLTKQGDSIVYICCRGWKENQSFFKPEVATTIDLANYNMSSVLSEIPSYWVPWSAVISRVASKLSPLPDSSLTKCIEILSSTPEWIMNTNGLCMTQGAAPNKDAVCQNSIICVVKVGKPGKLSDSKEKSLIFVKRNVFENDEHEEAQIRTLFHQEKCLRNLEKHHFRKVLDSNIQTGWKEITSPIFEVNKRLVMGWLRHNATVAPYLNYEGWNARIADLRNSIERLRRTPNIYGDKNGISASKMRRFLPFKVEKLPKHLQVWINFGNSVAIPAPGTLNAEILAAVCPEYFRYDEASQTLSCLASEEKSSDTPTTLSTFGSFVDKLSIPRAPEPSDKASSSSPSKVDTTSAHETRGSVINIDASEELNQSYIPQEAARPIDYDTTPWNGTWLYRELYSAYHNLLVLKHIAKLYEDTRSTNRLNGENPLVFLSISKLKNMFSPELNQFVARVWHGDIISLLKSFSECVVVDRASETISLCESARYNRRKYDVQAAILEKYIPVVGWIRISSLEPLFLGLRVQKIVEEIELNRIHSDKYRIDVVQPGNYSVISRRIWGDFQTQTTPQRLIADDIFPLQAITVLNEVIAAVPEYWVPVHEVLKRLPRHVKSALEIVTLSRLMQVFAPHRFLLVSSYLEFGERPKIGDANRIPNKFPGDSKPTRRHLIRRCPSDDVHEKMVKKSPTVYPFPPCSYVYHKFDLVETNVWYLAVALSEYSCPISTEKMLQELPVDLVRWLRDHCPFTMCSLAEMYPSLFECVSEEETKSTNSGIDVMDHGLSQQAKKSSESAFGNLFRVAARCGKVLKLYDTKTASTTCTSFEKKSRTDRLARLATHSLLKEIWNRLSPELWTTLPKDISLKILHGRSFGNFTPPRGGRRYPVGSSSDTDRFRKQASFQSHSLESRSCFPRNSNSTIKYTASPPAVNRFSLFGQNNAPVSHKVQKNSAGHVLKYPNSTDHIPHSNKSVTREENRTEPLTRLNSTRRTVVETPRSSGNEDFFNKVEPHTYRSVVIPPSTVTDAKPRIDKVKPWISEEKSQISQGEPRASQETPRMNEEGTPTAKRESIAWSGAVLAQAGTLATKRINLLSLVIKKVSKLACDEDEDFGIDLHSNDFSRYINSKKLWKMVPTSAHHYIDNYWSGSFENFLLRHHRILVLKPKINSTIPHDENQVWLRPLHTRMHNSKICTTSYFSYVLRLFVPEIGWTHLKSILPLFHGVDESQVQEQIEKDKTLRGAYHSKKSGENYFLRKKTWYVHDTVPGTPFTLTLELYELMNALYILLPSYYVPLEELISQFTTKEMTLFLTVKPYRLLQWMSGSGNACLISWISFSYRKSNQDCNRKALESKHPLSEKGDTVQSFFVRRSAPISNVLYPSCMAHYAGYNDLSLRSVELAIYMCFATILKSEDEREVLLSSSDNHFLSALSPAMSVGDIIEILPETLKYWMLYECPFEPHTFFRMTTSLFEAYSVDCGSDVTSQADHEGEDESPIKKKTVGSDPDQNLKEVPKKGIWYSGPQYRSRVHAMLSAEELRTLFHDILNLVRESNETSRNVREGLCSIVLQEPISIRYRTMTGEISSRWTSALYEEGEEAFEDATNPFSAENEPCGTHHYFVNVAVPSNNPYFVKIHERFSLSPTPNDRFPFSDAATADNRKKGNVIRFACPEWEPASNGTLQERELILETFLQDFGYNSASPQHEYHRVEHSNSTALRGSSEVQKTIVRQLLCRPDRLSAEYIAEVLEDNATRLKLAVWLQNAVIQSRKKRKTQEKRTKKNLLKQPRNSINGMELNMPKEMEKYFDSSWDSSAEKFVAAHSFVFDYNAEKGSVRLHPYSDDQLFSILDSFVPIVGWFSCRDLECLIQVCQTGKQQESASIHLNNIVDEHPILKRSHMVLHHCNDRYIGRKDWGITRERFPVSEFRNKNSLLMLELKFTDAMALAAPSYWVPLTLTLTRLPPAALELIKERNIASLLNCYAPYRYFELRCCPLIHPTTNEVTEVVYIRRSLHNNPLMACSERYRSFHSLPTRVAQISWCLSDQLTPLRLKEIAELLPMELARWIEHECPYTFVTLARLFPQLLETITDYEDSLSSHGTPIHRYRSSLVSSFNDSQEELPESATTTRITTTSSSAMPSPHYFDDQMVLSNVPKTCEENKEAILQFSTHFHFAMKMSSPQGVGTGLYLDLARSSCGHVTLAYQRWREDCGDYARKRGKSESSILERRVSSVGLPRGESSSDDLGGEEEELEETRFKTFVQSLRESVELPPGWSSQVKGDEKRYDSPGDLSKEDWFSGTAEIGKIVDHGADVTRLSSCWFSKRVKLARRNTTLHISARLFLHTEWESEVLDPTPFDESARFRWTRNTNTERSCEHCEWDEILQEDTSFVVKADSIPLTTAPSQKLLQRLSTHLYRFSSLLSAARNTATANLLICPHENRMSCVSGGTRNLGTTKTPSEEALVNDDDRTPKKIYKTKRSSSKERKKKARK